MTMRSGRMLLGLSLLALALGAASALSTTAGAQGAKLRFGVGPLQPTPSETKKAYEPFGTSAPSDLVGRESAIAGEMFMGIEGLLLKTLLPVDHAYDMAMNIFTFDPGFGLPMVETHVMEHGLLFLQGKGVYYLDGEWMEVEKDDFIWMGPYCPQSFYATGNEPAKYLYYKNVNREIAL